MGLIFGAAICLSFKPQLFSYTFEAPIISYILSGLLVGFGTRLGSGCTSGHGVCGIARLSKRSITATLLFIGAGIATVTLKGFFL